MWVNVPNVCVCGRGREFYFQFDGIWCECVVHAWYVLQCLTNVLYEIWCVAQQLLSKCQQPWWTLNIECHTRKSMPNVKCILISEHSNECFNSTHFLMLFSFFNLDAIDVHSCLSITGHGTTMQPNRLALDLTFLKKRCVLSEIIPAFIKTDFLVRSEVIKYFFFVRALKKKRISLIQTNAQN